MSSMEARLETFIGRAIGQPVEARITRRFLGGMSWLTYGFTLTRPVDGGGGTTVTEELILRLGHVDGLLSPYSATPEALVLDALAGSPVPVPRVLWCSDDAEPLGAPFLIVEKVEGVVKSPFVRDGAQDPDFTRRIGEQFVDILAALHNVDWQAGDAARLKSRPEAGEAAGVQIDRWERMIAEAGLRPQPLLHRAVRWLRDHVPVAPRVCIVHGDYRAGNFLQDDQGITAILDWELVHLGDPHEDLAWACMRFLSGGGNLVCGLIDRDVFMTRYQAATGIAVSPRSLQFYEVLVLVKVCAMNLRGASRVESGSVHDVRLASMAYGMPHQLLEIERLIGATP